MIQQCHISPPMRAKFSGFRDNWSLAPYTDRDQPAVFYGFYNPRDFRIVARHRALGLLVWCGSDVRNIRNPALKRRDNIRHIATSSWHERDLKRAGLPHRRLNLMGAEIEDLSVRPLGTSLYVYSPKDRPRLFNAPILREVLAGLPNDLRLIVVRAQDQMTRSKLLEAYAESFAGVRLSSHDGAALTVIELGMMGRRTIHNGDAPSAIQWKTADDVISAVLAERAKAGETYQEINRSTRAFIQSNREWLDGEWWS